MKQSKFPPGWDAERVKRVLSHYESQSEDEAVAEDEAVPDDLSGTIMAVPKELVPKVRELIAKHKKSAQSATSNNAMQRTSLVVTPLAGNASNITPASAASGAATARR